MRAVLFFVGIVLGLTITAVAAYGQAINFRRVTDGVLQDPPDSDWLQWRRTYDGWALQSLGPDRPGQRRRPSVGMVEGPEPWHCAAYSAGP